MCFHIQLKYIVIIYVYSFMSFCYRWVFSSNSIEDLVKKHLNPLLLGMRPKFIGKPLIISKTCNLVVCIFLDFCRSLLGI